MFKSIVERFRDPQQSKLSQALEDISKIQGHDEDIHSIVDSMKWGNTYGGCNVCIGADVMDDLEFFRGYRENDESVFSKVDNSILKGGSILLKRVLSCPVHDVALLQQRKSLLKSLDHCSVANGLETIKSFEADMCWLFAKKDDHIVALENMMYFKSWALKPLNKYPSAITMGNIYKILLSPTIGILSPIMYFIVPYYILKFKYKFNIGFKNYLTILFSTSKLLINTNAWSRRLQYVSYVFSLIFYFQGIMNSVELSSTMYKLNEFVLQKVDNIIQFLQVSDDLITKSFSPELAAAFFDAPDEGREYIAITCCKGTKGSHWLFTNFGVKLAFLKSLDHSLVKRTINMVYMLDAVCSIAQLQHKQGFSACKFVSKSKPILKVGGIWHPNLDKNRAIKNDLCIRTKNNVIITGPNAGGKSTLVKSVMVSVILAQTFTMVNADSMTCTPFSFLNSQISVPDSKGKESLFEAEMHRCKYNLDAIATNPGFSFVVMDEIFNSTNPVEGISGAYAVAKSMATNRNSLLMFTTHYSYLTNLENETKLFKNYMMSVNQRADNTFEFPYKLSQGVCKQYIALDLLGNKGFPMDIIDEARRVKSVLERV